MTEAEMYETLTATYRVLVAAGVDAVLTFEEFAAGVAVAESYVANPTVARGAAFAAATGAYKAGIDAVTATK